MRFGIFDMQLGALIPSGLSPQTTAEHLATFDQTQLVAALAGQGFALIELKCPGALSAAAGRDPSA